MCINNHIKEIFTVLLTTDLIAIKTLNYKKKLRRNRQKFEVFFFCKVSRPFFSEDY